MATGDFLFSGATPASFTSQKTDTSTMPAWYQDAETAMLTRASAIAGQPYQQYGGPRVAALTDPQNQAIQGAQSNAGKAGGDISQGVNTVAGAATPFNSADFQKYLDPYLTGSNSELSTIANLGTRNLTENILPAVNNGFISNGMFGSSRNGDFQDRALRDSNESILNQQSSVLNNAYTNAMGAYNTDKANTISAGTAMGALGQYQSAANQGDYNLLATAGGLQQQQAQNNLNVAHQDFVDQRDAPLNNLNMLNGVLKGYQPTPTSSTIQTNPLAGQAPINNGQQALGALTSLYGIGNGAAA